MFEDDEFCTITIDGQYAGTYYIGYQNVQYIEDGTLCNTGTSSITLYRSKDTSSYPRIQIPSLGSPRYYANNGTSYVVISDISRTDFNMASQIARLNTKYQSTIIIFMLSLLCLIQMFRGKRA